MRPEARSAATLGVLSALVLTAAVWGWAALTRPLPERASATQRADAPICVDKQVAAGSTIHADEVTVSVFNAGRRSGQAGAAMQALTEAGFHPGRMGNAPPDTGVRFVRIWAEDPDDPAVRLVARHLGDPVVSPNRGLNAPGVVVLVGNDFKGVVPADPSIVADRETTFCGPVEP